MGRPARKFRGFSWQDEFRGVISVQCSGCGSESLARSAGVWVPYDDQDEAELLARGSGVAWRIDEPPSQSSAFARTRVFLWLAPDLDPIKGDANNWGRGRQWLLTCSSCGQRRCAPSLDFPARAWFRCWVQGRPLHAQNRGHLSAIREYLGRGPRPRLVAARNAGWVHKLHGDIMRNRSEALRRIDQMLAPGWTPGRSRSSSAAVRRPSREG